MDGTGIDVWIGSGDDHFEALDRLRAGCYLNVRNEILFLQKISP